MGMTATERSRLWRAKHGQQGGRQLSIWIDGETARRLDELTAESTATVSELVGQAIAMLHDKNLGAPPLAVVQSSLAFEEPAVSAAAEPAAVEVTATIPTVHPLLKKIKDRLSQGEDINSLRPLLATAVADLAASGLSSRKIAALLNDSALPTFSGHGEWGKTTVARLLQGTKTP